MTLSQSTDETKKQEGQGASQFYILKQGIIQMTPAMFTGLNGYVSTEISRTDYGSVGDILLNSYDIYHKVQDPDAELQSDEEMIRLNYNFGSQKANAVFWYRYWAGAPGYTTSNIDIYYTADAASGSPYSADTTQNFHYIIYSQKPAS